MGMMAPEQGPPRGMMGPPPGMGGPPPGMQGPPPGMGPPGPPGPPPGGPGGGEPSLVDKYAIAVKLLRSIEAEETEITDRATVAKIVAQIQALLASQQKEADTATGVGPREKFMRRGGAGGP